MKIIMNIWPLKKNLTPPVTLKNFVLKIKKIFLSVGFFRIKKNSNCVRWGIIGLGYMGETLATTIDFSKDAKLIAVAARDKLKAQKFASKHGHCHSFSSYKSLIKDQSLPIDVIYVATPLETHYEIVKECLKAGRNVICEKPLTSCDRKLDELCEIANSKKLFFMEAMWMKCLPTFLKATQLVQSGDIGNVHFVRADFDKSIINFNSGGTRYSVIEDYGVYALSFVTSFLGGLPEKIDFVTNKSDEIGDTNWNIQLTKENIKGVINISSNFCTQSKAVVVCEKGVITWTSQFNRSSTLTLSNKNGKVLKTFKYKYKFDGFEYQVDEVSKCIKLGLMESDLVPLNSSLLVAKLMNFLCNQK